MISDIPDEVAKLTQCLPMRRYLELTKETEAAVNNRIQRKHWKLGEQYHRPVGGGTWVDLVGVMAWVRAGRPED